MDFVKDEQTLLAIEKKFENFKPFEVFYDEIDWKMEHIKSDLAEIKVIKTRIETNKDDTNKCSELKRLAEDVEEHLEDLLEALKEREEYLEMVKEDCRLNESDEGFFYRTFCSPDDEDVDE